jgi:hypothetical protein
VCRVVESNVCVCVCVCVCVRERERERRRMHVVFWWRYVRNVYLEDEEGDGRI